MKKWRKRKIKIKKIINRVSKEIILEGLTSYGDLSVSLLEIIFDIIVKWLDNEGYEVYFINHDEKILHAYKKKSKRKTKFKIEFTLKDIIESIYNLEITITKIR